MALVSNRKMLYERQLEEILNEPEMLGLGNDDLHGIIPNLRMLIEYEEVKMTKYKLEMARRRHNYIPFIITLLQMLAKDKKLLPLLEKAKERASKRGHKRLKT